MQVSTRVTLNMHVRRMCRLVLIAPTRVGSKEVRKTSKGCDNQVFWRLVLFFVKLNLAYVV